MKFPKFQTKYCLVMIIVVCIIYLVDSYNDRLILEDTKPPIGVKKQKKRTYEEFLALAKVDPKHEISIPWIHLPDIEGFLPTYLKYKEKYMTDVLDQGKCAACFSISVVHMIADRISLYTGGKINRPLSIQELLSCWNVRGDVGCEIGGIPEHSYEYIIENGISTDKDYPYRQQNTTKIAKCEKDKLNGFRTYLQPGSVRSLCVDPYRYSEGSRRYNSVIKENVLNMKKELLMNGPFVGTIMAYDNLYTYDGLSVYTKTKGDFVGGHAVLIIGWSDEGINGDEPGFDKAYWVIKNSWSEAWPTKSPASKGYMYIEMGRNVAGIESRASRALPVITEEITANKVDSLDEVRYTSYDDYVNDPERENYITKVGKMRSWFK